MPETGDITITATGAVSGGTRGIEAHNAGTGTIATAGDVTASRGIGILSAAAQEKPESRCFQAQLSWLPAAQESAQGQLEHKPA